MADSFSHSVALGTDLERAWAALQRPETWAAIAGVRDVRNPRRSPEGILMSYDFTVDAGVHRVRGSARTVDTQHASRMRVEITSAEITGWIETRLDGGDARSVTVELSMKPRGLLATMFYPLISETVGRGFPDQVQAFADQLENDKGDPPDQGSSTAE